MVVIYLYMSPPNGWHQELMIMLVQFMCIVVFIVDLLLYGLRQWLMMAHFNNNLNWFHYRF